MRYELTEYEWTAIKPMLPNKPRGVPRVNDRRVLNGILWVLRSGAPWCDLPESYGPPTTCYNRFVRWRQAGVTITPPRPESKRRKTPGQNTPTIECPLSSRLPTACDRTP